MSRKIELPDFDNIVQRYQMGEPIKELAREFGVDYKVIWRRFKKHGITVRGRRLALPDDLIARYLAGESEQALAIEYGVARTVIRRRLEEAAIPIRNISDSMYIRWQTADDAERQSMLTPAHNAVRGRLVPFEEKARRAAANETRLARAVSIEYTIADYFRSAGYTVIQQMAMGAYNIDVAIEESRVAIEVFGGNFHATGRHAARFHERTKYILDQGWHVLIVWADARRYPIDTNGIEHMIAYAEFLRVNPSIRRQYRVILGDGQLPPASRTKFNTLADVERLGCSDDAPGCFDDVTG